MYYGAKKIFNSKINFKKLLQKAIAHRQFVRAIAYVISKDDVDATNFVNLLKDIGFEVRIKNLRERADGSVKGNWDIQMAMDMVAMVDRVEVVVLVSGDGDFVSVVEWLQHKGVRVELFSFRSSTALDLIEKVDQFFEIGEDLMLDTVLEVTEQDIKSFPNRNLKSRKEINDETNIK